VTDLNIVEFLARASGMGVWALVGLAVVTLIKGWPALRKLSIEAEGSLRKDLLERIDSLEKEVSAERRSCDDRLREQDAAHREAEARLNGRIDGLTRQLLQLQQSAGIAIGPDRGRI
jgi:polyhydroxyalkanoate synthesis regulator phasin